MHMTNRTYSLSSGLCYVCFFSGSFYTHALLLKLLMSVYLQGPTQVPLSLRRPSQSLRTEAVPPLSLSCTFTLLLGSSSRFMNVLISHCSECLKSKAHTVSLAHHILLLTLKHSGPPGSIPVLVWHFEEYSEQELDFFAVCRGNHYIGPGALMK